MHSGKALFTVAGQQLVGEGGMVLVVPELTPHKFEVIGPERYRSVHIHASDTFITDWLEGPQGSEDLDAVLGLSAPRRQEEVLALNSADPEDAGPRGGQ